MFQSDIIEHNKRTEIPSNIDTDITNLRHQFEAVTQESTQLAWQWGTEATQLREKLIPRVKRSSDKRVEDER